MAALKWSTGRGPEPYYLLTPSFGINRALGGKGLKSGRIHVYWGVKGSGKTTAAMQQIAQAQREGKNCAYVDAEGAFDDDWAIKNGVDIDALKKVVAQSAEKILQLLVPDLEKGVFDLVVVDSLSSINYDAYFDTKDPTKNPMGSYARSAKFVTHKILGALGSQQHVIFISHAAMDISGTYPVMKAAVGNAIDHWASTMIKFNKMNGKDFVRDDGSFVIKWKIDKSKQSVYPVDGGYYFNPKTAEIDLITEIATYAVLDGLIDQNSAWFYYPDRNDPDARKFHGANAFADALRNEPEFLEEIKAKLNEIGVKAITDTREEDPDDD